MSCGRLWRTVLVVVALGLVTAACTPAPAAEPDRITLRVALADDWASAPVIADALTDFEAAHPGLRVDMQGVSFGVIPDTVDAAAAAGEPFDVAHFHPFALSTTAQRIDDLWEEHLREQDFLPGAVEDVTWEGHRYGVPLDTNATIMLVNRTRLEEVGAWPLPDPLTFAAFADVAAKATTGPEERALAVAGSNWTTYAWIRANGGELMTQEGTATSFHFTDPAVVETVDFLGRLISSGSAFPPVARNLSTDAAALFMSGATAFHITGSWDIAELLSRGDDVGFAWEARALPVGDPSDHGTALGGSSLYIPHGAAHRDLAFAFMLHLTSDRYAVRLAREEGRLPARVALLTDDVFDHPAMRVVAERLRVASPLKLLAFAGIQDQFQDAFERVFVSGGDAAGLLAAVQRDAEGA